MARTGRPRTTTTVGECPDGHIGKVRLAGFRRRADDAIYSRPLYWCYHSFEGKELRHRFTAPREHRTHLHPRGEKCAECGTTPLRHQGQTVRPGFGFEVQHIANALVYVGRGSSFCDAAETVRGEAYRYIETDEEGIAWASREGTTVARYLDHFGDAIVESVAHKSWPKILLLDAKPLRARVYDAGGDYERKESAGAFLAACGYTRPTSFWQDKEGDFHANRGRPHFWHIEFAGGVDGASWYEFLTHLEGEPEWVVCDDDGAIKGAAQQRWPNATIYSCEGHINELYKKAATKDRFSAVEAKELWGQKETSALNSPETWRAFIARVLELPTEQTKAISSFIGRHHALISEQFPKRRTGFPRGNGAMEAAFEKIDGWIGDRRRTFQNVHRLNIVLALMRAQIGGHANAEKYAAIVAREIHRLETSINERGHQTINWRVGCDPEGTRGVFALVDAAKDRTRDMRFEYLKAAQLKSLEQKVLLANAYHASLGIPRLVLLGASVQCAGLTLADFPTIMADWDYDANPGVDPLTVPAIWRKTEYLWRCRRDRTHTWAARPGNRCSRLTGCPICGKENRKGRKTGRAKSTPLAIAAAIDRAKSEEPLYKDWADHDFTKDPDYMDGGQSMSVPDIMREWADSPPYTAIDQSPDENF